MKNIRNLTKIGIEEYREGLGFREEKGVNKVVVRYADGRMVKGTTADFVPTKDLFHVNLMTDTAGAKPVEISTKDLKAVFFVKDFKGNSQHAKSNKFDPSRPPAGRKIRVEFKDGEIRRIRFFMDRQGMIHPDDRVEEPRVKKSSDPWD